MARAFGRRQSDGQAYPKQERVNIQDALKPQLTKYYLVLVTFNRGTPDEFTQEWGTATRDLADRDAQIRQAQEFYPTAYVHWQILELET